MASEPSATPVSTMASEPSATPVSTMASEPSATTTAFASRYVLISF